MKESLIGVAIILVIAIPVFKLISLIFRKIIKKNNALYVRYLINIFKVIYFIICLSLIISMFTPTSQFGVELFKSTGLLVAVLGFAAQKVLEDVLAGMVISWSKPYNIGERITISSLSLTGIVEDITLRHTVVKCYDNSRAIVPNSVMNKEILTNSNYDDSLFGNFMEVSISYDSDIIKACDLLRQIVLDEPTVIDETKDGDYHSDKSCTVQVKELGQSGIVLKTTVWTKTIDDNFTACSNIRLKIKEVYDKEGISIPYNTITVHMNEDKNERFNRRGKSSSIN